MLRVLTEDANMICAHCGEVDRRPSQRLVRIDGRLLLVDDDPERRHIGKCPNSAMPFKKCMRTLAVRQGYSSLVRIDGARLCRDDLTGLTDGTPPGVVPYKVCDAGQRLVRVSA